MAVDSTTGFLLTTGTTGDVFVTQLFFRLGGRLSRSTSQGPPVGSGNGADDLTGAGAGSTCISFINKAYSIIEGAATYIWDTTQRNVNVDANGLLDLSTFASTSLPDVGSNIEFTNMNGLPIARVPYESALQSRPGQFISINTGIYNNWYLIRSTSLSTEPGLVQFTPSQPGIVNMLYNRLPTPLTDGAWTTGGGQSINISVPWLQPYMDDLLVDFAEMEAKRILSFSGWQELEKRCLEKLKGAQALFSAQRKDTGPASETDIAKSGA